LERYRFRQLVRMLAQRKVVDFIRRRQRHRREVANDVALEMAAQEAVNDNSGPSHESVEESDAFQQAALVTLIDTLRREVSFQVFMIFDLVKLKDTPPEQVVRELGVKRGVVDNSVYKAMQKLREIAQRPDLQKEFSHE
jgi:RNA polymerase sigma-70 factor (ECF subfamily)